MVGVRVDAPVSYTLWCSCPFLSAFHSSAINKPACHQEHAVADCDGISGTEWGEGNPPIGLAKESSGFSWFPTIP